MGMSIDKSKRILVDRYIDTYVVYGGANYHPTINITREDYEAFRVAADTMRKYQQLQADMVALLEDLKEQLREMHEDLVETEYFNEADGVSDSMRLIEQKINALKED